MTSDHRLRVRDFKLIKVIGQGSFGKVILARQKGCLYALKIILKPNDMLNQRIFNNEKAILSKINHHFIAMMHMCDRPGCLVLEYCPGGDLFNLITKARRFRPKLVQFYGACILEALDYLHKNSILFKDLKSENVIISRDGFAKLIDFSLSEHQQEEVHQIDRLVANQISAPEVLQT
jgi:serine/threonine protein kinase